MQTTSKPSPIYLLAGGPGPRRGGRDSLLARALAAGGSERPSVAYVGAASGDNRAFMAMMAHHLRQAGAGAVTLAPLAGRRAQLDQALAVLEAADVVFMSGGDVEAGMRVLAERQLAPFLRRLYEAGKPFIGVSAGSIMLAQQWVRWDQAGAPELFPCLGLAPILCDTHGEAEAWEELRALLELVPEGAVGYGIPSGGGLAVHPGGALEALGVPVQRFVRRRGRIVRLPDLA